jgi:hypothetical protein
MVLAAATLPGEATGVCGFAAMGDAKPKLEKSGTGDRRVAGGVTAFVGVDEVGAKPKLEKSVAGSAGDGFCFAAGVVDVGATNPKPEKSTGSSAVAAGEARLCVGAGDFRESGPPNGEASAAPYGAPYGSFIFADRCRCQRNT